MAKWAGRIGAILATSALASCSTLQPPIRQIAVDSNRVFAESANEQTFLNLLRAKDKLPMHFSSFRYFRGNVQFSGTAGIGGSIVERGTQVVTNNVGGTTTVTGAVSTLSNGVDTISPSLGVAVASNPNFEVGVFDSKEFQNGILTPLKPSLIEFYLGQGWPDQFLSALLISSVDVLVETENGKSERFHIRNDPRKSGSYNFGTFIDFFEMVHKENAGKERQVTELANINDLSLGDIDKLNGSDFIVKTFSEEDNATNPTNGVNCSPHSPCVVQVAKPSRGISFKVRHPSDDGDWVPFPGVKLQANIRSLSGLPSSEGFLINCGEISILEEDETGRVTSEQKGCRIGIGKGQNIHKEIGTLKLEVIFRSPQSVMYFLGSYLRQSEIDINSVYQLTENGCPYKIAIVRNRFGDTDLLRVRHVGQNYAMPVPGNNKCDGKYHRGTQAIALVQQLINLHKSADSLPRTNAIQIVP